MASEVSFGSYVTTENGKRVVKELTYGNPAPEHVVAGEKCSGCDLCGMYCPDFAIFGARYAR